MSIYLYNQSDCAHIRSIAHEFSHFSTATRSKAIFGATNPTYAKMGRDAVAAFKKMVPTTFLDSPYAAQLLFMMRFVKSLKVSVIPMIQKVTESAFEENTNFDAVEATFCKQYGADKSVMSRISRSQLLAARLRHPNEPMTCIDGGLLSVLLMRANMCQGDVLEAGALLASLDEATPRHGAPFSLIAEMRSGDLYHINSARE